MRLSLDIPRGPEGPALARRIMRDRLSAELTEDELADSTLIVSELISNAFEHGAGAIRLRLSADERGIRGEVIDEGGGFEGEVRERGLEEVRGRGLWIVDSVAAKWGIHDGSSHVWFQLECNGGGKPARRPELGEALRPDELD